MKLSYIVLLLVLVACSEPAKQLASRIEVLPAATHNRLAIVSASPNPNLAPGKLMVLDLTDGQVRESSHRIGNDPLLKRIEQTSELAVVDRSHNTILFFDPSSLKLKREIRPLPAVGYTNFTDLLELPDGEMFAVSYESAWLYRLKISDGSQVRKADGGLASIPLHNFADEDGVPEAHKLVKTQDRVYLSLQRLQRQKGFEPSAYSSILAIDAVRNEVVTEHRLIKKDQTACLNPTTAIRVLDDGNLAVGCTGSYNDANSGGVIGVIDPQRGPQAYRGVLWEQNALLGKPSELWALDGGKFLTVTIDNLNRMTSVRYLEEGSAPTTIVQDPYLTGYRSLLYDDARKLVWLGKVTNKGGEILAVDPKSRTVVRRIDVEYDPVQLEWLD